MREPIPRVWGWPVRLEQCWVCMIEEICRGQVVDSKANSGILSSYSFNLVLHFYVEILLEFLSMNRHPLNTLHQE